MRRITVLSSLVTAAVALIPGTAGAAKADVSVAAPDCYSGATKIYCDAPSPVSPVTWTERIGYVGSTTTFSFSGPSELSFTCDVHSLNYNLSFSYVSGGVTYTSAATMVRCTSGPPA